MQTVQLDIRQLQAARHAAAKSDIRYYLNGIYVEAGKGVTRVVSTNGHIMYVHDYRHGLDQWEGTFIIPDSTIDLFVKAGKHTYYAMQIEVDMVQAKDKHIPFDTYTLRLQHGDKVVQCHNVSGLFPDYTRVIPVKRSDLWTLFHSIERSELGMLPNAIISRDSDEPVIVPEHQLTEILEKLNGSLASQFSLEYIAAWGKVQSVFKKVNPTIHHNGPNGAAVVTFRHLPDDHSAIGVMMTVKCDPTCPDTTPFRARLAITEVVEVNSTDTHDPESK